MFQDPLKRKKRGMRCKDRDENQEERSYDGIYEVIIFQEEMN
jgi:hypothetical protein